MYKVPLLPFFLLLSQVGAAHLYHPRSFNAQCQPFHTTFPSSSISNIRHTSYAPTPFIAISEEGSYQTTHGGLELYINKPEGNVRTKHGVNDKTADGATVNSTFSILHGKVTFEISAPTIAGVVTAAILIAEERDEIDVELLGGDPRHWQTNVFAPSPKDKGPLFGLLNSIEDVPRPNPTIAQTHSYTIDWSTERIEWGIDGSIVRTLRRDQTRKNGMIHYPSHPLRIQLGIWDASNPAGTAEWAGGPVDWNDAPRSMKAVVKSVRVECPVY